MKTPAILFEEINGIRLGEVTPAACGPGQIAARTLFSFVSPGTELRMLAGHYGTAGKYPFVPGYSSIGVVTEVGAEAKGFRVGDTISCRNTCDFADCKALYGAHAGAHTLVTTGEDAPVLLPDLPNEEDYLPYATLEVAAISLRGRIAADPKPGESCIVIGQGMIGVFSALLFHEAGCRVVVADIDKRRLAFGRGRGYATADLSEPDAEDRIVRLGDDGYDIVVEASGSIPGVELAFRLPRCKPPVSRHEFQVKPIHFYSHNWPRIVMQANYLEKVSIDPWDFMEGQGVTILTPFDRGFDERQKMVDLIQRGAVKMDEFVSVVHKPADMVAGYRSLQNREISALVGDWRPVGR